MSVESCFKAETGALIFGIISAVFTAIINIINIVVLVAINYLNWKLEDMDFAPDKLFLPTDLAIAVNVIYGVLITKFMIDFLFAVLLCDGICKKKPSHVKAYFIYGVVIAVLTGLLVIGIFFVDLQSGFTLLAMLAIYCLILHMVNVAHSNILSGEVYQFQHKRLVETVY